MRKITFIALALALGACSQQDITSAEAQAIKAQALVVAACNDAVIAAQIAGKVVNGGAAKTVANITDYVLGACGSEQAIAKVALDPATLQWLGKQQGALETLAAPKP